MKFVHIGALGDAGIKGKNNVSTWVVGCFLILFCLICGNLDSMLKSRNITLLTKVRIVKAMFFPIIMYGCESWIINKAEHRIIDAFELWCYRRLLRIPWQQGDQASQS